ncbi:MAG: TonB-dependent copper receptor [Corallincola sp.]|nr:TonB-dependent copper receptor [Corallincola sp.]
MLCRSPLCLVVAALFSAAATAAEPAQADEDADSVPVEVIVITGEHPVAPLVVETDPKQPRQPLPAADGGDYLKTIPGFNLIRKGGTSGDPLFRGMAGSRLTILAEDQLVLGGCGNRMDPPTAYIQPEDYDRMVVVKGPQTVRYGASTAATVRFEREPRQLDAAAVDGRVALTGASFGRHDERAELLAGNRLGYGELSGGQAAADDYEDGDGHEVHSAYQRWNGRLAAGWTPDQHSVVELSALASDGEAAYADRAMDGVKFRQDNLGLSARKENWGETLRSARFDLYRNDIDHVMDNYSLRPFTPSAMMANPAVSNPTRETRGSRLELELALSDSLTLIGGGDYQHNQHAVRSTMNQLMMPYEQLAQVDDARLRSQGLFAELSWQLAARETLIGGLRLDDWHAQDQRQMIGSMLGARPNPTANAERDEWLTSGFVRYELAQPVGTWYLGLGQAERFPDYWELIGGGKGSETTISAFDTRPERNRQIDLGWVHESAQWQGSASLFANRIDDYILIQSDWPRGMSTATVTRNIDSESYGGELALRYQFAQRWAVDSSLAYVHGDNLSDDRPLAQQPPLEGRLGLNYQRGVWSGGLLWRLVAGQSRVAVNQGNIVGQDLGESAGFGVLSINGGWQPDEALLLTAGIDNLLDKSYAEHLSRGGAMVAGFTQTTRVNEPGLTAWVKASYQW